MNHTKALRVHTYSQIFHLLSQLQHLFGAACVEQHGLLQRLVEPNSGRAMVNNRYLVNYSLAICAGHCQLQLGAVSAHDCAFAHEKRQPMALLQPIEQLEMYTNVIIFPQNYTNSYCIGKDVVQSLASFFALLWPHQQVNLVNIRTNAGNM